MDLAEEFLDRYRRGERPGLKEYLDRHPELSHEIREVFPAMAMMENIAISDDSPADESTRADLGARSKTAVQQPEQLGDFRIIREIGHGGMGVVYEAEQLALGRHVALKVLPPLLVRDHKQRQRFEREARSAAKLHHTNIVPVFGFGEHEGTAYYVMQHIQGLGIDDVIDELKRVRPRGIGSQDLAPAGRSRTALPTGLPPTGPTAAAVADLTAADVARSLLTGCLDAGYTADPTSSGPIADTVPDAAASARAPSPVGPAAGDPRRAPAPCWRSRRGSLRLGIVDLATGDEPRRAFWRVSRWKGHLLAKRGTGRRAGRRRTRIRTQAGGRSP